MRAVRDSARALAKPEPADANQRQTPRQPYVNFVWFQRIDRGAIGDERGVARSCDVAEGGIGFVTTHALPVGSQVFMVVVTPSGRVSAIGNVVHSGETADGNHRIGVAVAIVPPTDLAMWTTITGSVGK